MRQPIDEARLRAVLVRLGELATGPGTIFLVGGATAIFDHVRLSTLDVDLCMDPEPRGLFEAIRQVKDELDVNIELAAPSDFIPALPGWRERSRYIGRFGPVEVYHYDDYAQTLAKIERGHAHDLVDVASMFASGRINADKLVELYEAIAPLLVRYPGVDPASFRQRVDEAVQRSRA